MTPPEVSNLVVTLPEESNLVVARPPLTAERMPGSAANCIDLPLGRQNVRVNVSRDSRPIEVGDIYEDCAFHPVLCTFIDYEADELSGISLIDGSVPRSCSPGHCGPIPLSVAEAVVIKGDFAAHRALRLAEIEQLESGNSG